MKRLPTLAIVSALVLSLAVPSGAVFAMPEIENTKVEVAVEAVESESVELSEIVEPEVAVVSVKSEVAKTPVTQEIEQDETEDEKTTNVEPKVAAEILDLPVLNVSVTESVDVVIAQIQVGVAKADADPEIPANANNEYVSIYNNSTETVDVTGWCLTNNKGVHFACLDDSDVDYELEPRAYIGFSSLSQRPGHDSLMVRMKPGSNIVAGGDVISLIDKDGVIDSIEWNSNPKDNYAIERKWSSIQVGVLQTGIDSWDWKGKLTHHGYIEEMIECHDGTLATDEIGCPALPVECRNMPGLLVSKLSSNFEVDDEGNCFENQCQNLAGFYSEVPSGFLGHENKQCFLDILPISVTELLPNPKGVDGDSEFIELYNPNKQPVDLKWWKFYLNDNFDKSFSFPEGSVIEAEEYAVFKNSYMDFSLTNNSGSFRLSSLDGQFAVDVPSWSNARDDKSWSLYEDEWMYLSPSPGVENKLPEVDIVPTAVLGLADCGEGRERNPATGRCRNVLVVRDLAPCREGQYRSEETNRCRSIVSAVASALKPCADDQFRNPETNRCRKIASSEDLTDCGEGRERNPETNRCRNVQTASMPLAPFATEPTIQQVQQDMLGWWMFGGVSLIAVGYAGWQWRFEAGRLMQQVRGKLSFGSKQ